MRQGLANGDVKLRGGSQLYVDAMDIPVDDLPEGEVWIHWSTL